MYQMIKAKGVLQSFTHEAPTGIAAFIIAEVFYKFHSFSLECAAFLATWFVFSWLSSRVGYIYKTRDKVPSHD